MGHVEKEREELLGELVAQVRQLNWLGASFFRAVASRVGMNSTDVEVLDILDITGSTTAGRLAELTGLTTGAIAQTLNRLEEPGLVRRERDPEDGRRVIVQLAPDKDELGEIKAVFDAVEKAWDELASHYDDEQIAFLLEVLKRGNALSRREIARLREAQGAEEGIYSAPLGDLASGQLVVSGISRLAVRAGDGISELYRARFEGPVPDMKTTDGVVIIRFPRRLWALGWEQRAAEVTLSTAIPWRIMLKGGASEITAELGGLDLAGLEVKGGMSIVRLNLPAPSSVVRVRISGGASVIAVRRPAGVAARVHLKGWVSTFAFDDKMFSNVGNDVRLQSPGYEEASRRYDIEVSSSASTVTITSD